jgi:hypothetical protein
LRRLTGLPGMPVPPIEKLVAEGSALKIEIKEKSARLKEIEEMLIVTGVGDYEDNDGHKAKVIQPSNGISFPADEGDQVKVRELCGAFFGKLFEKVTTQKPVKNFEQVAAALLPKGAFNRLVKLCASEKSAYVKWS